MNNRIFGTDGVRGIVGSELSLQLSMNIGKAIASVICKNNKSKVIIAKDTRVSSDAVEAAVSAGLCSVGSDVILLGIMPTPSVCFLADKMNADAAVMISASHNSFEYNGIKIFNKKGYKLDDKTEDELEKFLKNVKKIKNELFKNKIGRIFCEINKKNEYIKNLIDFFKKNVNKLNKNLKIVIDCANGAAYECAEIVFNNIGFDFKILNNNPDGININENCGSTNLEYISKYVVENHYDIGIAFDGDSDRCLFVTEKGEILDGDNIIALCAVEFLKNKNLSKNSIVGTPMSNLGLINFLKSKNINFIETNVGDRYILEEILKNNYNFGGEQSGHIIFSDHRITGDGILTALMVISIIVNNDMIASDVLNLFEKVPQFLFNLKLDKNENRIEKINEITQNLKFILDKNDKLFIRESGTEPLIRVMVQSHDNEKLNKIKDLLNVNSLKSLNIY